METPSSTTRVTRSQTAMATVLKTNNNNIPISSKIEETEKDVSQSRRRNTKQQQDRFALIDITNDSPIVGLATGSLVVTPSSSIAKQRSSRGKSSSTPGSGEALLRGQVKTLLQRVEDEAEISKISLENRPFRHLQGFVNSPMAILAPTPANTPQIPNLSVDGDNGSMVSVTPLPVIEEQPKICQVSEIFDGKKQESLESQRSLNRSLMEDFSEKSDISSNCSSVLTSDCKDNTSSPPTDDDNASIWSIQVNASTCDEEDDDDEEEVIEGEEEVYYHDDDDGELLVNELCAGISKISAKENNAILTKFSGKHKRFVYNSDDEMVEEEAEDDSGSGVLHLKGLPTPKGKHLRFPV